MCRSVPQMAVFSTLIRTSLGPGCGTGTSSIQMPLAASRLTSAFMVRDIGGPRYGEKGKTGIIGCRRNHVDDVAPPGQARPGDLPAISHGAGLAAAGLESGLLPAGNTSMRMRPLSLSVFAALLAAPLAHAAEGMWVPQQL